MALAAGTRLGLHEIVALLGAGGMGEVYRALDPRLEREVRAVAALNRPNILTAFDVGTADTNSVRTESATGDDAVSVSDIAVSAGTAPP